MSVYRFGVILVVAALALAACGGDGDGGGGGDVGGGDAGGGSSLEVTSPEDGADVSVPFTVEIDTDEPIGPTESGDFHFHLIYDGDQDNYDVCESTSCEVTNLDPGEHTIVVSLRNADHSAAGDETEISVNVTAGGGGDDDGGLDY